MSTDTSTTTGPETTHPDLIDNATWFSFLRDIAEADPFGDGMPWLAAADFLAEQGYVALGFILRCGARNATYELSSDSFSWQHHPSQKVLDSMAKRFGMAAPLEAELEPFNLDLPGTPNAPKLVRGPAPVAFWYVMRCALADSLTIPDLGAWKRFGPVVVRHRYSALRWVFLRDTFPAEFDVLGGPWPTVHAWRVYKSWRPGSYHDCELSDGLAFHGASAAIPADVLPYMRGKVLVPDATDNPPELKLLRHVIPSGRWVPYWSVEDARLDLSAGLIRWALDKGKT